MTAKQIIAALRARGIVLVYAPNGWPTQLADGGEGSLAEVMAIGAVQGNLEAVAETPHGDAVKVFAELLAMMLDREAAHRGRKDTDAEELRRVEFRRWAARFRQAVQP